MKLNARVFGIPYICPVAIVLACLPASQVIFADVLATDNASDPAYSTEPGGAWGGLNPTPAENPPGMDNGGIGFSPWDFTGGYHAQQFSPYGRLNHFIDGVDFESSSFNNLGMPAFALTNANQAYFGYTARATRPFASSLNVGDTLSVDFDNPMPAPLTEFDTSGYLFRLNSGGGPVLEGDPSAVERFGFFVSSGFNGANWTTSDMFGLVDSGVNALATTSGARFRFTLTASDSYSFELIRLSDDELLFERAGMLLNQDAGLIDAIEITMYGNGSGNGSSGSSAQPTGEREFFFNNLRLERPDDVVFPPGDYNRNGVVDAADYVVWRNDGGTLDEYDTWRTHFGATAGRGSFSVATVPEPCTFAVFAGCAVVALASRRTCAIVCTARKTANL